MGITSALALLALAAAPPPPPPPAADQALARELLRALVAIDTTEATGNTTTAANLLAKRLRRAGLRAADVRVLGPKPRKGNLVARLRGRDGTKKPLLLLGHLDVVAARRDDWSVDPFVLTEKEGYLYGRGTEDMKGLDALWVATVIRLLREGYTPERDIVIALTADEENGPDNGVEWLLAHHRPLIEAAFALNEGGGGELDGGKRRANTVQASEKGYTSFRLEVRNKGGHSSLPVPDNAIVRLADALGRVHRHVFPAKLDPITRAYFARSAPLETGATAAAMKAVAGTPDGKPLPAEAVNTLAGKAYLNARLRTTCVPTQAEAGHAENALPQRATAIVNCRLFPGETPEEVERTLLGVVNDPEVTVSRVGRFTPGPPSPLTPEVLQAIETTTERHFPGVPVIPIMSAGATDGRFLRAAGIPVYGVSGLFREVNDIRAHGRDERIGVTAFSEAQGFVYDLVKALAGGR